MDQSRGNFNCATSFFRQGQGVEDCRTIAGQREKLITFNPQKKDAINTR